MDLTKFDIRVVPGYESWLKAQIRQLSVAALRANALTCNACGEIAGTYVIEYDGQKFRLPAEETFTFLQFIVATSATSVT